MVHIKAAILLCAELGVFAAAARSPRARRDVSAVKGTETLVQLGPFASKPVQKRGLGDLLSDAWEETKDLVSGTTDFILHPIESWDDQFDVLDCLESLGMQSWEDPVSVPYSELSDYCKDGFDIPEPPLVGEGQSVEWVSGQCMCCLFACVATDWYICMAVSTLLMRTFGCLEMYADCLTPYSGVVTGGSQDSVTLTPPPGDGEVDDVNEEVSDGEGTDNPSDSDEEDAV